MRKSELWAIICTYFFRKHESGYDNLALFIGKWQLTSKAIKKQGFFPFFVAFFVVGNWLSPDHLIIMIPKLEDCISCFQEKRNEKI